MNHTLMRFKDFKLKAVTLSYDDGVSFDERLIEIMSKNGLRGTFNINSGMFADKEEQWRMTKEKAYKLYTESGNEVAVHGEMHLALAEVAPAVGTADIIQGRLKLEEMFSTIVTGMAYAHGSYSDGVVEMLKNCGIEYARTTVSTEKFDIPNDWLRLPATCHHNNPRLMELAHQFIDEPIAQYAWGRIPKLFYLWGHSYEFNNNDNWEVIEEFAEYIGNRDDIWYATNGEICRYVKAFDLLIFSANGKMVYNPTAIDVYICAMGKNSEFKNYLIPAGKTVELS